MLVSVRGGDALIRDLAYAVDRRSVRTSENSCAYTLYRVRVGDALTHKTHMKGMLETQYVVSTYNQRTRDFSERFEYQLYYTKPFWVRNCVCVAHYVYLLYCDKTLNLCRMKS